jgi:hypothetical protein
MLTKCSPQQFSAKCEVTATVQALSPLQRKHAEKSIAIIFEVTEER